MAEAINAGVLVDRFCLIGKCHSDHWQWGEGGRRWALAFTQAQLTSRLPLPPSVVQAQLTSRLPLPPSVVQAQLTSEFIPALMAGPDPADLLAERPDDAGATSQCQEGWLVSLISLLWMQLCMCLCDRKVCALHRSPH